MLHEHVTLTQAIGVVIAIFAAILLSLEPKAPDSKSASSIGKAN
jgi:hypothetical protein